VTAVSAEDARLLEQLADRPVTTVPNSIDVRAYRKPRRIPPFDYDLVITGKMDYRPNVDAVLWFGQEIWPLIRHIRPATTWAIVGKNPHPRLRPLHGMPGVIVTGRVEQIQPYLDGGRVYIMPFRIGSGTRLKLIEAMAAGKAIVTTALGAEGFPVEHGKQVLVADAPEAFARAVLQLLQDHGQRRRLGEEAIRFAGQYDWRVVVPRFEAVYQALETGEAAG
jgi:glycosyltransferase involved in cell wall biosynthesis